MTKNSGDVILRDRMQFTLSNTGDQTTLYGRVDLSAYVNPIDRSGLSIKSIYFHLRNQDGTQSGLANTGMMSPVGDWESAAPTSGDVSAMKIYATTRAYENASEVGIASPDVLCVEEIWSVVGKGPLGADTTQNAAPLVLHNQWYGPEDLHPQGYTVVSDLLVGVAVDKWITLKDQTIEIDILMIAEPVKVTEKRLNEILSQAQDL